MDRCQCDIIQNTRRTVHKSIPGIVIQKTRSTVHKSIPSKNFCEEGHSLHAPTSRGSKISKRAKVGARREWTKGEWTTVNIFYFDRPRVSACAASTRHFTARLSAT